MPSFGLALQEMVIARLLERQARERPDRTFVHYGEERWSFAEVEAAAASLAGGLRELGVKAGDRVGLFLPNGPAFINAYFALGKLGATMVPVNTAYRGYMLEYLLNDTALRGADRRRDAARPRDRVGRPAVVARDARRRRRARADVATPWRTVAFETLPASRSRPTRSVTLRRRQLRHLHLGHDRPVEGRADHERARHLQGDRGDPARRDGRGRRRLRAAAALPQLRAAARRRRRARRPAAAARCASGSAPARSGATCARPARRSASASSRSRRS